MSRWAPRVTVATVVERDGRYLLVEEQVDGAVVLNQPAGHLEPGESLAEAAVRETLEETGWSVRPEALLGVYRLVSPGDGLTFLRFAFAAKPLEHHPERALDAGILQAVWLTPGEIHAAGERLRSPLVTRTLDDHLAGVRLPLSTLQDVGAAS